VRRSFAQLVLLVSALPACLLYTDPINKAPAVTIKPPPAIQAGTLTFHADSSDPDGDPVTLRWTGVHKPCAKDPAEDWAAGESSNGDAFQLEVTGHQSFCVRVVAQDRYGARSIEATYDGALKNQDPEIELAVTPALSAGQAYPLFTTFRVAASPLMDADGDPVTFTWKGVDGSGTELQMLPCEPDHPQEVRCFSADTPGTYMISVQGSDGVPGSQPVTATLPLAVMDDSPPCIEATDPSADTDVVVMAVSDPPRRFEVRQVRDDGNPFPIGPHGVAGFQWSTAGAGASWQRYRGYDRPTFDVGASLFDDVRPGSTYRVRVEVRDPRRELPPELHAVEVACEDRAVCKLPETCVRWLTWSVRFR
jgi:hypothetical protein